MDDIEQQAEAPTVHHLTGSDLETGAPELGAPRLFTGATRGEIADQVRAEIAKLQELLAGLEDEPNKPYEIDLPRQPEGRVVKLKTGQRKEYTNEQWRYVFKQIPRFLQPNYKEMAAAMGVSRDHVARYWNRYVNNKL